MRPLSTLYCLTCRREVDKRDMIDNGVGYVCKKCHKKEKKDE